MERRFLIALVTAGLFVPAVLLCDGPGPARQIALGAATAGFLLVYAYRSAVDGRQIACAIVIATLGEITLSAGLGLYDYQHAWIPLYVPFGHGLFYSLAVESARQEMIRERGRLIVGATLIIGSIVSATSLLLFSDAWGMLWWIAAAMIIARSRNALLLSICCAYTMLLEWLGTSIGNWSWIAEVPIVSLRSANPPSGVGILYVILDLVTVIAAGQMLPKMKKHVFADGRAALIEAANQV